jgi:hypothetical protein
MVTECLTSHPKIECYGAIFLPNIKPGDIFVPEGYPHIAYCDYHETTLGRRLAHKYWRKPLIARFLEEFYQTKTDAEAFGFKLMYPHTEKFPQIVPWLKANNVKVIHLIRKNMVRTLVSNEVAHARGAAHATQHMGLFTVKMDPQFLLKELKRGDRLIRKYRQVFGGKNYLEITYESFVKNREEESERVLKFLGIEPIMTLTTKLVKQNTYTLRQVLENFDEVAAALKGTPYEPMLDDKGL